MTDLSEQYLINSGEMITHPQVFQISHVQRVGSQSCAVFRAPGSPARRLLRCRVEGRREDDGGGPHAAP